MASPYTDASRSADALGEAIADFNSLKVGIVSKVTSSTTIVVTHTLAGAPDFMMVTPLAVATTSSIASVVATTTHVTITLSTASDTVSFQYIFGYTA
jgi:hypothetical protein